MLLPLKLSPSSSVFSEIFSCIGNSGLPKLIPRKAPFIVIKPGSLETAGP
jgi:hypothetical protein